MKNIFKSISMFLENSELQNLINPANNDFYDHKVGTSLLSKEQFISHMRRKNIICL
jgi:hypothetical protein